MPFSNKVLIPKLFTRFGNINMTFAELKNKENCLCLLFWSFIINLFTGTA